MHVPNVSNFTAVQKRHNKMVLHCALTVGSIFNVFFSKTEQYKGSSLLDIITSKML